VTPSKRLTETGVTFHRAGGRGPLDASVHAAWCSQLENEPSIRDLRNHGGDIVDPLVASTLEAHATSQLRLQQVEAGLDPLLFDAAAARALGRVPASLHRAGRTTGGRSHDAMIAAHPRADDLPLCTCIPADLAYVDGLDLQPVPHPDRDFRTYGTRQVVGILKARAAPMS
jgi:predicted nucleic acid-binding protein